VHNHSCSSNSSIHIEQWPWAMENAGRENDGGLIVGLTLEEDGDGEKIRCASTAVRPVL